MCRTILITKEELEFVTSLLHWLGGWKECRVMQWQDDGDLRAPGETQRPREKGGPGDLQWGLYDCRMWIGE